MLGLSGKLLTRTEELHVSNKLKLFVLTGQTEGFCRKKSDVSAVFNERAPGVRYGDNGLLEYTNKIGIIPFASLKNEELIALLKKAKPIEPELGRTLDIEVDDFKARVTVHDKLTYMSTSVDFCDLEMEGSTELEQKTALSGQKKKISPYNLC